MFQDNQLSTRKPGGLKNYSNFSSTKKIWGVEKREGFFMVFNFSQKMER
jgi:hypothetical protein